MLSSCGVWIQCVFFSFFFFLLDSYQVFRVRISQPLPLWFDHSFWNPPLRSPFALGQRRSKFLTLFNWKSQILPDSIITICNLPFNLIIGLLFDHSLVFKMPHQREGPRTKTQSASHSKKENIKKKKKNLFLRAPSGLLQAPTALLGNHKGDC